MSIVKRPVWYIGPNLAESFETVEEGRAVHGRAPDSMGTYLKLPDGTWDWLDDEPWTEKA